MRARWTVDVRMSKPPRSQPAAKTGGNKVAQQPPSTSDMIQAWDQHASYDTIPALVDGVNVMEAALKDQTPAPEGAWSGPGPVVEPAQAEPAIAVSPRVRGERHVNFEDTQFEDPPLETSRESAPPTEDHAPDGEHSGEEQGVQKEEDGGITAGDGLGEEASLVGVGELPEVEEEPPPSPLHVHYHRRRLRQSKKSFLRSSRQSEIKPNTLTIRGDAKAMNSKERKLLGLLKKVTATDVDIPVEGPDGEPREVAMATSDEGWESYWESESELDETFRYEEEELSALLYQLWNEEEERLDHERDHDGLLTDRAFKKKYLEPHDRNIWRLRSAIVDSLISDPNVYNVCVGERRIVVMVGDKVRAAQDHPDEAASADYDIREAPVYSASYWKSRPQPNRLWEIHNGIDRYAAPAKKSRFVSITRRVERRQSVSSPLGRATPPATEDELPPSGARAHTSGAAAGDAATLAMLGPLGANADNEATNLAHETLAPLPPEADTPR